MAQTILIVDDERRLVSLVQSYLTQDGFRVVTANNGREALAVARKEKPDLIILDIMMPEMNGYDFMRQHRNERSTPIILLTARVDDEEKVVGLELGADDYLPKPFNPRELVARINAVLRRKGLLPAGAPGAEEKVIAFGGCELNLATRVLTRAGAPVSLTTGEFALLKALVTHPRHPLSRDKLMELARGRDHDPFDRAIDVQVSRLRKLVEPDPAKLRFIQTVWGHGYVFVPDGVKS